MGRNERWWLHGNHPGGLPREKSKLVCVHQLQGCVADARRCWKVTAANGRRLIRVRACSVPCAAIAEWWQRLMLGVRHQKCTMSDMLTLAPPPHAIYVAIMWPGSRGHAVQPQHGRD